jgi:transcriptional regulator with XRE-family HTH domain
MQKPHLVGPTHAKSILALRQKLGAAILLRMAAEGMSAEVLAARISIPLEHAIQIISGRDEDLDLETLALIADNLHATWDVYLAHSAPYAGDPSRPPDAA